MQYQGYICFVVIVLFISTLFFCLFVIIVQFQQQIHERNTDTLIKEMHATLCLLQYLAS